MEIAIFAFEITVFPMEKTSLLRELPLKVVEDFFRENDFFGIRESRTWLVRGIQKKPLCFNHQQIYENNLMKSL